MTATLVLDLRSSFDMSAAIGQLSPVLADLLVPDATVTAAVVGTLANPIPNPGTDIFN